MPFEGQNWRSINKIYFIGLMGVFSQVFFLSRNPNLALKYCSDVTVGLLLDMDFQKQKKYKKTSISQYSRFKCLTSS